MHADLALQAHLGPEEGRGFDATNNTGDRDVTALPLDAALAAAGPPPQAASPRPATASPGAAAVRPASLPSTVHSAVLHEPVHARSLLQVSDPLRLPIGKLGPAEQQGCKHPGLPCERCKVPRAQGPGPGLVA